MDVRQAAEGSRKRLPLVSVVVPAYNEATIIEASLTAIWSYLNGKRHQFNAEVVVINDGSSDGTGDILDALADRHPTTLALHHADNLLLGQALRTGFARCSGDYVVTLDCDLSYSPDNIGRLVDEAMRTGADVVIASPYTAGGSVRSVPWPRRFASVWANRMLALVAPGQLTTLTSMVRSYDGAFLRSLDLKSHGPEINAEIVYKAGVLRASVREIPADLNWTSIGSERAARRANTRTARSVSYTLRSAFFFAPYAFFLITGLLVLLTGSGLILLLDSPRGILFSGILAMAGFGLASMSMLALMVKRYFEELFHLGTTILTSVRSEQDRARGEPRGQASITDEGASTVDVLLDKGWLDDIRRLRDEIAAEATELSSKTTDREGGRPAPPDDAGPGQANDQRR